jgi:Holliday junction resolvase RusA-like endonuclease
MDRVRLETLRCAPPYDPAALMELRDRRVPWWVTAIFVWQLPKSYPAWMHGQRKTTRPDVDNLLKGVLDAMTETGRFWIDDSQVGIRCAYSRWAFDGESPRILITVEPDKEWQQYVKRR